MRYFVILAFGVLSITGCGVVETVKIDSSISSYRKAASKVKLGDTKEQVLSVLSPSQQALPARAMKSPDSYKRGDDVVEIYYFRSGRQADGLNTDDEFTPYIFINNSLAGIGWAILGGPTSRGEIIQPAPHVEQNVIVR